MSFKTSVLIWFSRFRGILPHPQPLSSREGAPNGVRLLFSTRLGAGASLDKIDCYIRKTITTHLLSKGNVNESLLYIS